ncbi:SRPBCC domain-containing protein [Kribbella sp. NPDC048915]|uniref:SRPBCC domain-containing protein n=1 Tax=Kribbella sp. NPDC048915 TaxID=3155148 RepID=UPI0033E2D90D
METVEREVYVDARPEVIWTAVTQPETFARWYAFGGAELDLRPGGRVVLRWDEHGEFRGFVEKLEPGRRFAYRYAVDPGVDPTPANSNLVEFTLTPEGEGTRLLVVESGFENADDEDVAQSTRAWGNALTALSELAPTL